MFPTPEEIEADLTAGNMPQALSKIRVMLSYDDTDYVNKKMISWLAEDPDISTVQARKLYVKHMSKSSQAEKMALITLIFQLDPATIPPGERGELFVAMAELAATFQNASREELLQVCQQLQAGIESINYSKLVKDIRRDFVVVMVEQWWLPHLDTKKPSAIRAAIEAAELIAKHRSDEKIAVFIPIFLGQYNYKSSPGTEAAIIESCLWLTERFITTPAGELSKLGDRFGWLTEANPTLTFEAEDIEIAALEAAANSPAETYLTSWLSKDPTILPDQAPKAYADIIGGATQGELRVMMAMILYRDPKNMPFPKKNHKIYLAEARKMAAEFNKLDSVQLYKIADIFKYAVSFASKPPAAEELIEYTRRGMLEFMVLEQWLPFDKMEQKEAKKLKMEIQDKLRDLDRNQPAEIQETFANLFMGFYSEIVSIDSELALQIIDGLIFLAGEITAEKSTLQAIGAELRDHQGDGLMTFPELVQQAIKKYQAALGAGDQTLVTPYLAKWLAEDPDISRAEAAAAAVDIIYPASQEELKTLMELIRYLETDSHPLLSKNRKIYLAAAREVAGTYHSVEISPTTILPAVFEAAVESGGDTPVCEELTQYVLEKMLEIQILEGWLSVDTLEAAEAAQLKRAVKDKITDIVTNKTPRIVEAFADLFNGFYSVDPTIKPELALQAIEGLVYLAEELEAEKAAFRIIGAAFRTRLDSASTTIPELARQVAADCTAGAE
ncbi:MAG: hypothetical protein ABH823_05100 [bacterium]